MKEMPNEISAAHDAFRDVNPGVGRLGNHSGQGPANDDPLQSDWWQAIMTASERTGTPIGAVEEIFEVADECGLMGSRQAVKTAKAPSWTEKLYECFRFIKNHPGPIGIFAVLYSLNDPRLNDLYKYQDQTAFARKIRRSKAAVCQMVLDAQREIGLPERADQRKEEAKENMATGRNGQLKRKIV